jgi:hypothetical protein
MNALACPAQNCISAKDVLGQVITVSSEPDSVLVIVVVLESKNEIVLLVSEAADRLRDCLDSHRAAFSHFLYHSVQTSGKPHKTLEI